jgi:hypothetical protein
MFVTTIGALLYKAYEAFFMLLPNAEARAQAAKVSVGQFATAQIIIGAVDLVLVVAALILAYDAFRAMRASAATVETRAVS